MDQELDALVHEAFDARLEELVQNSGVGQEVLGEVLSRVALKAPDETSRVEIASGPKLKGSRIQQKTYLQGTVSKAVKVLLREGLLEDGKTLLRNDDGRPLAPLRLGQGFGIAGAKVILRNGRPHTVVVGLTGLDGTVLALRKPRTLEELTTDPWGEVARVLHDEITELTRGHDRKRAKEGREPLELFGVGVEVGAHVHEGRVILSPGVSWDDVPLATMLADLFKDPQTKKSIPVVVENDVNALAVLATHEQHYTESDLVVVAVFDEGIGGGLVMDGRLRRGGNGMAMELGHLTLGYPPGGPDAENDAVPSGVNPSLRDFNPICPCGSVGHLDAFATPRRIREALGVDTTEEAVQAPACTGSGDPTPQHAIFRSAGAVLGRALGHVINIVNPNRLVLYLPAELDEAAPDTAAAAYRPAVEEEMTRSAYSTGRKTLEFATNPMQSDKIAELGARAAAFCVLNSFIDHAKGVDGCPTPQRRTSRGETAA